MTAAESIAAPAADRAPTAIVVWLACCCVLIFATVVLGAAVRLTGSGLSMVDWRPLTGAIPPLDSVDWRRAFAAYQQSPEFRLVNPGMTLAGFKFIFWFEYAHRLLGRVIGAAFLLPFLFFLAAGRVSGPVGARLWALFALGAAQGVIGWLMVKSGLTGAPHVSHYRLALHFMLAVAIYAYLLRVVVGIAGPRLAVADSAAATVTVTGKITVAVILLTMLSGVFVAGTRAGFAYNTWPAMDGAWLPAELFALQPWWRNFTDNIAAVQFTHRWLAVLALAAAAAFAWRLIRDGVRDGVHGNRGRATVAGVVLLTVAGAQVILGIATLLLRVPVVLGVAHQAGALLLLTAAVTALAMHLPPLTVTKPRRNAR